MFSRWSSPVGSIGLVNIGQVARWIGRMVVHMQRKFGKERKRTFLTKYKHSINHNLFSHPERHNEEQPDFAQIVPSDTVFLLQQRPSSVF